MMESRKRMSSASRAISFCATVLAGGIIVFRAGCGTTDWAPVDSGGRQDAGMLRDAGTLQDAAGPQDATGTLQDAAAQQDAAATPDMSGLPMQWTPSSLNPLMHGASGGQLVSNPDVLYDEGLYKLWFEHNMPGHVAYSTSPDGLVWSSPIRVVSGPNGSAMDPSVLREGAGYRMWYAVGGNPEIRHATSTDGVTWAEGPITFPTSSTNFDTIERRKQKVLFAGGLYRMWYSAKRSSISYSIGYSTSADGLTWQPGIEILTPAAIQTTAVRVVSVVKWGDGFLLWYDKAAVGGVSREIAVAYSPDGVQLTHLGVALTATGSVKEIQGSGTVMFGNPNRFWYSCKYPTWDWGLCFAQSP